MHTLFMKVNGVVSVQLKGGLTTQDMSQHHGTFFLSLYQQLEETGVLIRKNDAQRPVTIFTL
jgi:hypothetical protein